MGECDYNLYCLVLLGWAVIVWIYESFVFMWHHLSLVMNLIQTLVKFLTVPNFSFSQYKIKDNGGLSSVNNEELTINLFQQMTTGG